MHALYDLLELVQSIFRGEELEIGDNACLRMVHADAEIADFVSVDHFIAVVPETAARKE